MMSTAALAQFDFGGPKKETAKKENTTSTKRYNLADKPNRTDAQGRKQGEWAKKYDNGQYRYVATFKDDKPVGKVVRYHENGRKSSEMTYMTNDTVKATYYNEAGQKEASGKYVNKKRTGAWDIYNERGVRIALETYKNGVIHGKTNLFYENGQTAEEMYFVDGTLNGPWFQYKITGSRQLEATYVKGKLEGAYRFWDDDGTLSVQGQYSNGTQVGDWKVYDTDAKEFYYMKYDNFGHLTNEKEVTERINRKLDKLEEEHVHLLDPQDFVSHPEEYIPQLRY